MPRFQTELYTCDHFDFDFDFNILRVNWGFYQTKSLDEKVPGGGMSGECNV